MNTFHFEMSSDGCCDAPSPSPSPSPFTVSVWGAAGDANSVVRGIENTTREQWKLVCGAFKDDGTVAIDDASKAITCPMSRDRVADVLVRAPMCDSYTVPPLVRDIGGDTLQIEWRIPTVALRAADFERLGVVSVLQIDGRSIICITDEFPDFRTQPWASILSLFERTSVDEKNFMVTVYGVEARIVAATIASAVQVPLYIRDIGDGGCNISTKRIDAAADAAADADADADADAAGAGGAGGAAGVSPSCDVALSVFIHGKTAINGHNHSKSALDGSNPITIATPVANVFQHGHIDGTHHMSLPINDTEVVMLYYKYIDWSPFSLDIIVKDGDVWMQFALRHKRNNREIHFLCVVPADTCDTNTEMCSTTIVEAHLVTHAPQIVVISSAYSAIHPTLKAAFTWMDVIGFNEHCAFSKSIGEIHTLHI